MNQLKGSLTATYAISDQMCEFSALCIQCLSLRGCVHSVFNSSSIQMNDCLSSVASLRELVLVQRVPQETLHV